MLFNRGYGYADGVTGSAVTPDALLRSVAPSFLPVNFTTSNFESVITDSGFTKALGMSLALAGLGIGVLSGASLTTEKAYLMGKFARVCLGTKHIDYNGRLCMVSAGAANKKAFGIDRTTNPWSDMVGTEVIWVAGSNVAGSFAEGLTCPKMISARAWPPACPG